MCLSTAAIPSTSASVPVDRGGVPSTGNPSTGFVDRGNPVDIGFDVPVDRGNPVDIGFESHRPRTSA
ncbi:MAG: hypothetical protein IPF99_09215 [Deltaproteobacteria bacterium]|nr:hypothetical protein [Deltaproteobacteria bacterium]